jgi:hypothetical protein
MQVSRLVLAALIAACATACSTTKTSSPPGLAEAVVLRSHAVRAWDFVDGSTHLGSVVRFEEPGSVRRAWFSVRNPYSQEIGIVDVDGRAWRYRPHQREPEWIGTGTVRDGVARILDARPTAVLVDVALDEIATRGTR